MNSIKSLALLGLLLTPLTQADELPAAIKAVEGRGAKVVGSFDAPGGLKGYAARYNGQGLALYLTADGEHVLIGTLLDAKGGGPDQGTTGASGLSAAGSGDVAAVARQHLDR